MDDDKQIAEYLDEVARVLVDLHVPYTFRFHILITGGAYMILHKKRKFTEDIDFALIQSPQFTPTNNQIFTVQVTAADISSARSPIPFSAEFKQAVYTVAARHRGLATDWLNDEAAEYYYDDAPQPDVQFWRSFHDILFVYLPTLEYIFATKIAAYRPKDETDIKILMRDLSITSREQAQAIIDRYLLPQAQEFWEVKDNLDSLFP
jgi:hypothetical protein